MTRNHIVNDWINIEDIENDQLLVSEFDNRTIRMNVFPRAPNQLLGHSSYRYTANCAPIVKVNEISENAIIHVVERMLMPVTKTVLELVETREDMTIFRQLLRSTKLDGMLQAENNKYQTVFAPTDKAFEKMDPIVLEMLKDGGGCALSKFMRIGMEWITNKHFSDILKNHLLEMTFCAVAVAPDTKTNALNSLGESMQFEHADSSKETVKENSNETDAEGDIVINEEANIIMADVMGTNGVLHIIDTVLSTESGNNISKV